MTTKPTTATKPFDPIAQLLALPHPPPTLLLGSGGRDAWAVRLLARLLAAHPCSKAGPDWLDLSTPAPGMFEDHSDLPALVANFRHGMGLTHEDDRCSAETWAWLGCRDPLDLGEVILAYARADAYACAREIGGDNRGEWVKRYLGWEGKDAQWCAGAATTWVNLGRARLRLRAWDWGSNRLSSSALVKHASKHDRLYVLVGQSWAWERKHGQRAWALEPRRGDLCIVRGGGTHWRHTTLLDHVANGRAYVIEGNVRPLAWLTDALWRMLGRPAGIVRPGSYPLSQVVFVRTS